MMAPVHILFGALWTLLIALALGLALLRSLRLALYRGEELVLAFVTGSALLSTVLFALAALHFIYKGVFLALGFLAIAVIIYIRLTRSPAKTLEPLERKWKWIFIGVFAVFTVFYLVNAMTPETSPDGTGYHLRLVRDYYRAHGLIRIPTNIYASLSQGIELLYLIPYSFGKFSAASLTHFLFLATLPLLILFYARRFGFPIAGVVAALMVYVVPVVGIDGTSAYIDVATAAVIFALFYFLQIWDTGRNNRWLIPIGILAGFCFAAKYTAAVAIPYALILIAWKLYRARQPLLRPALTVASLAIAIASPWLVKNWVWMHNPVAPFENRWFPNPYVHISFEDDYRAYFRTYDLMSRWQIPTELLFNGIKLNGLIGPVYLLAPLGLLALRWRAGRQVLLAAAVFLVPYFDNIGARFLIPVLPFISLALALALRWQWAWGAVLAAQLVLCWPSMLKIWSSEHGWFRTRLPLAAALRLEPEDHYLGRTFPEYVLDRIIQSKTPAGSAIFSFGGMPEIYTDRTILVGYQAAFNEVLSDILLTPLIQARQPNRTVEFHFPPQAVRKLRLIEAANAPQANWSVTEFRVYQHGQEVARSPHWRLTAQPNPWDVQLAFDNDPVTRWKSWEPMRAGMYLEIDFGALQTLDAARAEMATDGRESRMRLEGLDASGRWFPVPASVLDKEERYRQNLRFAATYEAKARGIRWVLVHREDFGAEDFLDRAALWGWKMVGDCPYGRLYHLE